MSRYQNDPIYREQVKARNKEFQKCLREDSRRMDWLRAVFAEEEAPALDILKELIENPEYGASLPDQRQRRSAYQYCPP
jgi:hypothetical protein